LDYAKFEGNLKRILAEKHSLLLVAESEKKDIVGFTLGRPLESVREDSIPQESKIDFLDHNPSKKIFFLNGSFVHKDYRNSGLTKHFLRWREAHARDLGYSHSLITTVNPAIEHIAGKEGYGLPLLQELVGGAKYFLKKL
jgi:GNAT superfamily N-acetyltransferase